VPGTAGLSLHRQCAAPARRADRAHVCRGTGMAMTTIGVISDTQGYVDPRVFELFASVDHILHAGDIGPPGVVVQHERGAATPCCPSALPGAIPGMRLPEGAARHEEFVGIEVAVAAVHLGFLGELVQDGGGFDVAGVRAAQLGDAR